MPCLDVDYGWRQLSPAAMLLLQIYLDRAEEPPAEDPADVRAEILALQEGHVNLHRQEQLVLRLRRILAVNALGHAMSRQKRRQPFMVMAGPAHRGECAVCGTWIQDVQCWRDPTSDRRWCVHHGATITD